MGEPADKKKWYQEGALYHEGELEKEISALTIEQAYKLSNGKLVFFQVGEEVGIVLHNLPGVTRQLC